MANRNTRSGKGSAVLKFIIGLLLVFIVCAGGILFIREFDKPGNVSVVVPDATILAEPEATAETAEHAAEEEPEGAEEIPAEEAEEVAAEPVEEARSVSALQEGVQVPEARDDVSFGMVSFDVTAENVPVTAYLSCDDIPDENAVYYLVAQSMDGRSVFVFDTWDAVNDTGLNARCFSGCVSGADLPDGWYRVGLLAVEGDVRVYVPFSEDSYQFVVNAQTCIRYAE